MKASGTGKMKGGAWGNHRRWNLKVLRRLASIFTRKRTSGIRSPETEESGSRSEIGRPLTSKLESMKTRHTAKQADRKTGEKATRNPGKQKSGKQGIR
jgi:hypothetical protein